MLVDGIPYFIDFQGGRRGPVYYDVASFAWQARARYSDELKESLIQTYLQALKQYVSIEEKNSTNSCDTLYCFARFRYWGIRFPGIF